MKVLLQSEVIIVYSVVVILAIKHNCFHCQFKVQSPYLIGNKISSCLLILTLEIRQQLPTLSIFVKGKGTGHAKGPYLWLEQCQQLSFFKSGCYFLRVKICKLNNVDEHDRYCSGVLKYLKDLMESCFLVRLVIGFFNVGRT